MFSSCLRFLGKNSSGNNRSGRSARRVRLAIEALEDRNQMSILGGLGSTIASQMAKLPSAISAPPATGTVVNGTLHVKALDGNDYIRVTSLDRGAKVAIDRWTKEQPERVFHVEVPAASVTQILAHGGKGNDTFVNNTSIPCVFYGDDGDDIFYGGWGNDTAYGGHGNDEMWGQGGNDVLYGHSGNDKLYGGSGNDRLFGGYGSDYLIGGYGNDYLDGDQDGRDDGARDRLVGGGGADIFVKKSQWVSMYSIVDLFTDYNAQEDRQTRG